MSESRGRPLPFHTFCAQTAHPYIHTSALCAITTNTLCCLLAVRRPHSEGTKVVDSAVLRFPKAVTHFSPGVRAWVHICQAICSEHSLFTHMPEYITLTPCLTLSSFWGYVPYCRATSIAPSRRPVSPTCFWRGTGSRVSPTVPMGSARRGHTSRVGCRVRGFTQPFSQERAYVTVGSIIMYPFIQPCMIQPPSNLPPPAGSDGRQPGGPITCTGMG